jgi:hypothetical protein
MGIIMALWKRCFLIIFVIAMSFSFIRLFVAFAQNTVVEESTDPGAWRHYYNENRFIYALIVNNTLWTSSDVSVVAWDLNDMSHLSYTKADGLLDDISRPMAEDPNGGIWFGSTVGLVHFDGENWNALQTPDEIAYNTVNDLLFDQDDHMWVSFPMAGVGHYDGESWQLYKVEDGLAGRAMGLALDANGDLWVGTDGGTNRFDGTDWHTYTTTHGLLSDFAVHIAIDTDQHIWATHGIGVSEFNGTDWITYTQNLSNVFSVNVDSEKTINGLLAVVVRSAMIITAGTLFHHQVDGIVEFLRSLNLRMAAICS